MTIEFNRYAIERTIKAYSNDVLSACHMGIGDKENAIARAQSLLSDFEYLQKVVDGLREQVKEAQRCG